MVAGDLVLQDFEQAPTPISQYIYAQKFRSLIKDRTAGFVGRDFIFTAVDGHVQDPQFPSGYIVISGEPGIGKTAIMAELIRRHGYVHHFNIAAQNIRSPRDFLKNICAQLIVRYKLDVNYLPPHSVKDSGYLSELLGRIAAESANHPIVVLVDALDEAEDIDLPPQANRLFLPPSLPDGVHFIVTTREKHDYRLYVDWQKDIYLQEDSPDNLKDIRQYIRSFVRENQSQMISQIDDWGIEEKDFVETMTEKSEGNFMYVVHVLRDICIGRLGQRNIDDVHKLPKGLKGYYQRHWRWMQDQDLTRFKKYFQPVVCLLAAAREPVTVKTIVAWTKLESADVQEVIRTWREFLNEDESPSGEPLYRIYHTSFRDFLQAEVGLKGYHSQIAQAALQKIPGLAG
ncbi:MAG: ATP-binding protein [Gammaproteobacteria bacterium]